MTTQAQWQAVEEELKGLFCRVKFRYQGHEISVNRERTSESKMELAVYIDGEIRGAWFNPESDAFPPVVKDVWRLKQKAHYSAKQIKDLEKAFGKRRAKQHFPRLHEKMQFFDPTFTTAASLVRQYKRLKGIEVVAIGLGDVPVSETA